MAEYVTIKKDVLDNVIRAFNEIPCQQLSGDYKSTYELVSQLENILKVTKC